MKIAGRSDVLKDMSILFSQGTVYRGADKSLARQGRKQANFSVRMA